MAAANVLCQFSADAVKYCLKQNIPFTIENPSGSLFWLTSFWAQVPTDDLAVVDFQACAFGGKRPKWTRIVSNMPNVLSLYRLCLGCQDHAPWGRNQDGSWATAAEAAYPHGLATALAQVFLQKLQEMSISVVSHAVSNQEHRQLGQTQPAGAGLQQLVHEWKVIAYVVADAAAAAPLTKEKRLTQEWSVPQGIVVLPAMTKLPAGTQILSRTQKGGKLSPLLSKELESKPGASVFRVGIPWTYVEFIREASKHGHPYHSLSRQQHELDGLLKELVQNPI